MNAFTNSILSFLFPRRCLGCGKFGSYVCPDCISSIAKLIRTDPICPVCVKGAVGGATHPYCQTRYTLDGLTTVFRYTGLIVRAVRLLKYQRVTDLSDELSQLLFNTIYTNRQFLFFNLFMREKKPVIIPIPLHWMRKRQRWFNQAEVLSEKLAILFNSTLESGLLIRTKAVKPQAELKREDRLKNVKGIFSINPNFQFSNSNASFLLFDDVWTTGSTIREAASVLKRAGAKTVWALTIAR